MIIALRTAVEIALQLASMDQLGAAGTFDPTAESILLRALDFNLRLTARKKAHRLELIYHPLPYPINAMNFFLYRKNRKNFLLMNNHRDWPPQRRGEALALPI